MIMQQIFLSDEAATIKLGAKLATITPNNFVIYLYGELGAGKTTLVRGFLQKLGHVGRVKSPTYTIMETYQVANKVVHHLDLYRITDPEELNFIGIRDFVQNDIWLIEWPERGKGFLPNPDLCCYLKTKNSGRMATFKAENKKIISQLEL
jgi:tRNA threonylcarbamoyladenosine biosynthesis protein TsaE